MTTRVLAYEGITTTDGRVIDFMALELPTSETRIPLLVAPQDQTGHDVSKTIGYVDNIRRIPGDHSTAKIVGDLHTDFPMVIGSVVYCPEIDIDHIGDPVFDAAEVMHVTQARLRAVTLGTRPAWPGLYLETVPSDG